MSLLMEALRKAEEAKRRMQQEEAARGGGEVSGDAPGRSSAFTLEERDAGVTPQYIRDNFASDQNALPANDGDEQAYDDLIDAADAFVEEAAAYARAAPVNQRAAAASVFAAKQNPARNRRTLTILVAIMLLTIPLGGGILWYLQAANTSSIGLNPALANYDLSARSFDESAGPEAPVPASSMLAAAPAAAEAVDTPLVADNAGASPGTAADAETLPPATEDGAMPTAVATQGNAVASARVEDAVQAPSAEPVAGTANAATSSTTPASTPPSAVAATAAAPGLALPAGAPAPVLEVSRSRGTPQVDPDLVAAYSRLQDGDIAGAGTLYRQVLATLPNNRDALLGMALVHMREGRGADARELYVRLLELNPRDALAHTGLLQTMQTLQASSPAEHENALKGLIAQFPNVAQLTLALGNHYAAQGRWSEAQGAYYNALLTARRATSAPVHPDYAFNLAVSLEQLNQPQAALDYYRQAQALAAEVTPGFDIQQLNDRLDFLLLEQAPR